MCCRALVCPIHSLSLAGWYPEFPGIHGLFRSQSFPLFSTYSTACKKTFLSSFQIGIWINCICFSLWCHRRLIILPLFHGNRLIYMMLAWQPNTGQLWNHYSLHVGFHLQEKQISMAATVNYMFINSISKATSDYYFTKLLCLSLPALEVFLPTDFSC